MVKRDHTCQPGWALQAIFITHIFTSAPCVCHDGGCVVQKTPGRVQDASCELATAHPQSGCRGFDLCSVFAGVSHTGKTAD